MIHETAIIEQGCKIGSNTKVWQWVHVMETAIIGDNCIIGQNCFIAGIVGNGCKIQNNVSVYKGVTLEDDVFLGPSCVLTNVKKPRADTNQKDNFLPTLIKKGATIGANATIICGITIGERAMIGAGAIVTKDVESDAVVIGVAAKEKDKKK